MRGAVLGLLKRFSQPNFSLHRFRGAHFDIECGSREGDNLRAGGRTTDAARVRAGRPAPAIMRLSEVRAGMEGYALTVFKGTKPEPFKVRVVSVLRNFLPKEDVILIRAEDPRVEFTAGSSPA